MAKPRDSLILLPGSAPRGTSSGYPGITHGKILCAEFLIQEEVIREGNNLSWHTRAQQGLASGEASRAELASRRLWGFFFFC